MMRARAPDPRRRLLLSAGGGLLLSAALLRHAGAADVIEIEMGGSADGQSVWFRPRGLLIQPGQTVRWTNRQAGNAHSSTAYHPDNHKPLRIPQGAKSWNSDLLLPNQSFEVKFELPGVYDYFCMPHEMAGMVGRIVVGHADPKVRPYAATDKLLPAVAVANFPDVASILAHKRVD